MNRRTDLLYTALALAVLLALLQAAAIAFYLYWSYWWYDVLMHFLGGLTGGLAAFWVLFHSGLFWRSMPSKKTATLATLFCLMTAGVLWEVMEFQYGMLDSFESYPLDVFNDLVLDASGALLAAYIGLKE